MKTRSKWIEWDQQMMFREKNSIYNGGLGGYDEIYNQQWHVAFVKKWGVLYRQMVVLIRFKGNNNGKPW